ncbi:glycosyltransferase [Candidatus Woesebacteria bacterium]|nr:MAG: glycosyltransferase [Candidatus Woesebacteria bacterium]
MKYPKVSIIIPTFNEEKNIKRLLVSIGKQSYKNIESIVVDDGSTDKTVSIANKYATRVYARKHAERSIQRNFGANRAKGDYLVFLDADMELTPNVVLNCIEIISNSKYKALIIPEKTTGGSFMSRVRRFEREMYMGDATIEVARFFDKKIFNEFDGYDVKLTGAEDYDLPYRISKRHKIGWSTEWLLHHEETLTLPKQLRKKYYYAAKSASYAKKHPELISSQGNMLFRKAYFKNWKKFIFHPILGLTFIAIRILEATSAILGYISAVGINKFLKTLITTIRKKY